MQYVKLDHDYIIKMYLIQSNVIDKLCSKPLPPTEKARTKKDKSLEP